MHDVPSQAWSESVREFLGKRKVIVVTGNVLASLESSFLLCWKCNLWSTCEDIRFAVRT